MRGPGIREPHPPIPPSLPATGRQFVRAEGSVSGRMKPWQFVSSGELNTYPFIETGIPVYAHSQRGEPYVVSASHQRC